jgi:hypothetical protein
VDHLVSCAQCGWQLGLGTPGAVLPCARCGCWVASKAIRGDFEDAASGLLAVAVFALLGLLLVAILALVFGRSGAG